MIAKDILKMLAFGMSCLNLDGIILGEAPLYVSQQRSDLSKGELGLVPASRSKPTGFQPVSF
jgi:hypothetical protein